MGTDLTLNSVFFLNPDVGWIGGRTCPNDSNFFRTTDGGQTWQLISILPPCDFANDMFFLNELHGFVVGDQSSWETTDGGTTWQQFPLGFGNMHSITFSDSLNGWMVGGRYGNGNLRIFHTSDGGQGWQPQDSSMAGGDLFDVAFADSLNGWASAGPPLHTTDGGKNWSYQTAPGSGVGGISPISPATAWGISSIDNQFVKFTYDSGRTWQQKQFTNDDLFGPRGSMFSDSLHGWIVGNAVIGGQFAMTIYHTTDGGNIWIEEARNLYGRGLNAVYAVDSQHVWAVGSDGSIVNYGYNSTAVEDSDRAVIPREYFLSQNYPNPFNSSTAISYTLFRRSRVRLEIFNIAGEKVKVLLNQEQTAGSHQVFWDGTDFSGKSVSSGIYLYQVKAGDFVETKKMQLIK